MSKRTIYLSNNTLPILKEIIQTNLLNTYNLIFYDYKKILLLLQMK